MKSNPEPKVIVQWQPSTGEPSPSWRKLWSKLLSNRERQPTSTGQPSADTEAEKRKNTETGGTREDRKQKSE